MGNMKLMILWWVGWLLIAGISTVNSISVNYSLFQVYWWVICFGVFLLASLLSEKWKERIKLLMIAVVVLGALWSLMLMFIPGWGNYSVWRWFYPQYGYTPWVGLIILILPEAISKLRFKIHDLRFMILVLGIVFSFSRMAWGVGLLEILIIFLTRDKIHDLRFKKLILIGVVATFVFIGLVNRDLIVTKLTKPLGLSARVEYWAQAVRGFSQSPIWGNGPDTFRFISKKYKNFGGLEAYYAHNSFLQSLTDLGVIGAVWWGLLVLGITYYVLNYLKINNIGWLGILGFILLSMTDMNMQEKWFLLGFWLFIATLSNTGEISKRSKAGILILLIGVAVVGVITNVWQVKRFYYRMDELVDRNLQLSETEWRSIKWWNKGDVGIYIKALRFSALKEIEENYIYQRIFDLEYWDWSYDMGYAKYLFEKGDYINSQKQLIKMILKQPQKLSVGDKALLKTKLEVMPVISVDILSQYITYKITYWDRYAAKLLYMIGTQTYKEGRDEEAEVYWSLATKIAPGWSYFWIDLANLIAYRDKLEAIELVKLCMQNSLAKDDCRLYLDKVLIEGFAPPLTQLVAVEGILNDK